MTAALDQRPPLTTPGAVVYRDVTPDLEIRAASAGGDGRTVEGIAVPYSRPVQINRELREQFAPGAFAPQLARPWRVPLMFGHRSQGGVLIGKAIELREDAAGLWGAFRISATSAGEDTLTLIRDGVLDELSIGFREGRNQRLPDGTIERVRAHLFEVASVIAGAYGRGARVLSMRAQDDEAAPAVDVDLDAQDGPPAEAVSDGQDIRTSGGQDGAQDGHQDTAPAQGEQGEGRERIVVSATSERPNAARAAQLLARMPVLPLL